MYISWADKSKYYPNPKLACIGNEEDSDFIRPADLFPDPDMSF